LRHRIFNILLFLSCFILFGIIMIVFPQNVNAGTGQPSAGFTIGSLMISPAEANTGQNITISATIKETNNISGNYAGTLKINGTVEATQLIFVGSNESKTITFTISINEAGVYSVDLDGLTGSLTVTGEPVIDSSGSSGSSASSFPTVPVVIGIIAVAVIVGLFIFSRVKKGKLTTKR